MQSLFSLLVAALLLACVAGKPAPVAAPADPACVPFVSVLGRAGYPDKLHDEIQGYLAPFFQGVMFLPKYAQLAAYQATHPTTPLEQLLYHHMVPFLSPNDQQAGTAGGLLVRTLLDIVDNPTVCPAGNTAFTAVSYSMTADAGSVNKVPVVSEQIDTCNVGTVLLLDDVVAPVCFPTPAGVKAVVRKSPAPKKDKCATDKTVLQVLAAMGGGAKMLAGALPASFNGTVFVPSTAALAVLSKPEYSFLKIDKYREDIALYHAVPQITLGKGFPTAALPTLLSDSKKQSLCPGGADGKLLIASPPLTVTASQGAPVLPSELQRIEACNGVVYVIDTILLPCDPRLIMPSPKPSPIRRSPIVKSPRRPLPPKRVAPRPPPPVASPPPPVPVPVITPVPTVPDSSAPRASDPSAAASSTPTTKQVAANGAAGQLCRVGAMMALAIALAALLVV